MGALAYTANQPGVLGMTCDQRLSTLDREGFHVNKINTLLFSRVLLPHRDCLFLCAVLFGEWVNDVGGRESTCIFPTDHV